MRQPAITNTTNEDNIALTLRLNNNNKNYNNNYNNNGQQQLTKFMPVGPVKGSHTIAS